jgi:hypothetical protein
MKVCSKAAFIKIFLVPNVRKVLWRADAVGVFIPIGTMGTRGMFSGDNDNGRDAGTLVQFFAGEKVKLCPHDVHTTNPATGMMHCLIL